MSSPQSPIEVVRGIYAAMAARDIAAVLSVIGPDLVLTQDPRLPWGGRFEGPDGFATFGLALVETVDSAVTIEAVFEADDEVIQMGRTKGTVRSNGAAFDIAEVHRWTIRDGLAIRAHFAIDTPAMLEALDA
ncbi:MAG TPA: nuclear transport factor 2 family protein [Iamia sp.]|jgi:ketosteroid isomerase-like protein|nr:nuclear transport factor 2 family protein [Iamia sp.]